jgi:hypothetical protein
VPFPFVAHQAPLLLALRHWQGRVDPTALCVGALSPDIGYGFPYLIGRFDGLSKALHSLPSGPILCVPFALVLTWCVRHVIAPVVPDHLPRIGTLRVQDYRCVAQGRHPIQVTVASILIGALSHSIYDAIVTRARSVGLRFWWFRRQLFNASVFNEPLSMHTIGTYVIHAITLGWGVLLLARFGSEGWLKDRASTVTPLVPTRRTVLLLWCTTGIVTLVVTRPRIGDLSVVSQIAVRMCAGVVLGLMAGSTLVLLRVRKEQRTSGVGKGPGRDNA